MNQNFDIQDFVGAIINIATGPDQSLNNTVIISQNEIRLLTTPSYSYNNSDLYNEIRLRLKKIRTLVASGVNVSITKSDGTVINNLSIQTVKELETLFFNTVSQDLINVDPLLQGSFRQLIPQANKKPRNKFTDLGDALITSESAAENRLIDNDDVSLRIGHIEFDQYSLGPDSIVFNDLTEVNAAATVRSDSDIAIKSAGGRMAIEIDIVFSDTNSINNKLRPLLGLLRTAPIVPVGGSALSAVLLNRITSSNLYNELKSKIFKNKVNADSDLKSTFNQFTSLLDDSPELDKTGLIDLIGSERDTFRLLNQINDYESALQKKSEKYENEGYKAPSRDELIGLNTFLLPLVIDNITVSTISSAAGSLRVRLSFIKSHNSYSQDGSLVFIDSQGYPTYNINKCTSLIKAIETVYLNPRRGAPQKDGSFNKNASWNKYYIPRVGDKFTTNEGKAFQGIDQSGITTSEQGHNLYKDPNNINNTSPLLMRFNTPNNTIDYYTYVPSDMVLQSVTWSQSNKISEIALEGVIYPSFQVMGKSLITAAMTFATSNKAAVQRFMTVKNSMDQISSFQGGSTLLRREFCDIYNDVLNLSGSKRFIISNVQIENAQDNPNLYYLHVNIVSNEENIRDTEALTVREVNTGTYESAKKFWWWMYAGLVQIFSRNTKQDISIFIGNNKEAGNTAGHTEEELRLIWNLVFGSTNQYNIFEESIVENNILLASFLQMILDGKAGPSNFALNTSHNYFVPESGADTSINKYLQTVLTRSKIGAESNKTTVLTDRYEYNGSHDAVNIVSIMSIILDIYKGSIETPWWYVRPEYQQSPFAGGVTTTLSARFLSSIRHVLTTGPNGKPYDTPVTYAIIQPNKFDKPLWIPTPQMWDTMFGVIMSPSKFRSNRSQTEHEYVVGYFLTDSTDDPAFYITPKWLKMRDNINFILSSEDIRIKFKSFWNKNKKTDIESASDSRPKSNSIVTLDGFDPSIYEYKNNYKDIPLPRYIEIFGDAKDNSGYDVWRKVAPSYLELGIAPDLFLGLSSAFNVDNEKLISSPGFLTPRSQYDYCDPGFFYYKKSWLIDSYNQIIDRLNNDVDNGSLTAFGTNEDPRIESAEDILKRQEQFSYGDPEIVIGEADMGIVFDAQAPVSSAGVITLNDNKTIIDLKQLAGYIESKIKEIPTSGVTSTSKEVEYIDRLRNNKIKHIRVIIGGKQVGILVSSKHGRSNNDAKTITYQVDLGNGPEIRRGNIVNIPDTIGNPNVDNGLYFVDMTNFYPRNPSDTTYKDVSGVIEYNLYKKGQAKQTLKSILDHIGDLRNNYMRAYPTFKLYFVKEKIIDDRNYEESIEDDMYGYSSVIDLSIVLDKEDAATAVVKVTDITGTLSSSVFKRDVLSTTKDDDSSDEKYLNKDTPFKFKLEIGTNIVIKMGYGHDPNTLNTVFTGSIVEIEPGDITTIVAQSYRTEMYKYVNKYSETGVFDGLIDRYILKRKVAPISPEFLVYKTLVSLAKEEGLDDDFSMSGLPHFGRFINRGTFMSLSKDEQNELRDNISKYQDDLLSASARRSSSLGDRLLTTVNNFISKSSIHNIHTNAMRNVFLSDDPITDSWWDYLSDEWVINSNGWQALKEISRYKVGYICQELPYGNRATLFIGKPDQLYHYKPISAKVINRYNQAFPQVALGVYKTIYDNIIYNFRDSKDYGNKNSSYRVDKYGPNITDTELILRIVNDLIDESKLESTKGLNDITTKLYKEISDPGIFGSYKLGSEVIALLKNKLKLFSANTTPSLQTKTVAFETKAGNVSNADEESTYITTKIPVLAQDSEIIYIDKNIRISKNDTLQSSGLESSIYNQRAYNYSPLISNLKDKVRFTPGLIEGQVLAISSNSKLISAEELTNRFGINPTTGLPAGINIRGPSITIASDFGYSVIDLSNINNGPAITSKTILSQSYKLSNILIYDNLKYLDDIRSYGAEMLKLIFCSYYGIGFTKVEDKISLLSTNKNIERIIDSYSNAIMKGIGTIKDLDSLSTTAEAIERYNTLLLELVKQINIPGSTIKYKDIKSGLSTTSSEKEAARAEVKSYLRDSIIDGSISSGDYEKSIEILESIINKSGTQDGNITFRLDKTFNDEDSFAEILLSSSDDFKLLLIFFSKFLKNNANNGLMKLKSANAMLDLAANSAAPGVKVFRDTHHITTGFDIVENNIVATMSHMANNILLITPRDIKVRQEGASDLGIVSVDENETSWIPYPNYSVSGVDFNPYVSPELRKQRQVKERNAETDTMRASLLINHMAEAIRPMYRGNLKIVGKVIKPYDLIVLADSYKDMFGIIEVERVIHTFNANDGWITTIIPHAYVNPLDESAEVAARFNTRYIDYIYAGLTALEWISDIALVTGLLSLPSAAIKAGVKKAAAANIALGAKANIANNFKAKVSNYFGEIFSHIAAEKLKQQAEQELLKAGLQATKQAIATKALQLASAQGLSHSMGQFLYGTVANSARKLLGSTGLRYIASAALLSNARSGFGLMFNMQTDWMLTSATLPLHVFTLTRLGRPFQSGLDMRYQRFFTASERLGIAVDQMYRNAAENIRDAIFFSDKSNSASGNILKGLLGR